MDPLSFTKKDGMFCCDYCGAKYDVSEVKKMVSGEVEIKNTPKIKGYLQLALDQYENGDLKKAEATTEKVIMIDPTVADNWYLKALIHKEIENTESGRE